MLGFILGLEGSYTKYLCFLFLWDSRVTDQHYIQEVWPERGQVIPGVCNVIHEALVPIQKILLPPLHVKLGLLKQFVITLDPNYTALHHIRKKCFLIYLMQKRKVAYLLEQIHVMLASRDLEQTMTVVERNAWEAFRMVVMYFLGKTKCENYEEIVESLSQLYEVLGC